MKRKLDQKIKCYFCSNYAYIYDGRLGPHLQAGSGKRCPNIYVAGINSTQELIKQVQLGLNENKEARELQREIHKRTDQPYKSGQLAATLELPPLCPWTMDSWMARAFYAGYDNVKKAMKKAARKPSRRWPLRKVSAP